MVCQIYDTPFCTCLSVVKLICFCYFLIGVHPMHGSALFLPLFPGSVLFILYQFAHFRGNCRLVQYDNILLIHRIFDGAFRNSFYCLCQFVLFLHFSSPFPLQYYIYSLCREEY